MSAQCDFIEDDGHGSRKADRNQVLARQWASDLFASFSALKSAVWERYGRRLKECFGDGAAKLYAEAFESARALVDASGRDDSESLRLRFHCPAWMAEQFKSREREAAVYVNEFTDLLLDVRRRARS